MNSLIDFDEKTANILAVDDDWENLLLLSDILKANGYKVRLAETAEQAFEQIEASKPDVILLDIAMPTTSGYEICKKIKQNAETRDIPVIFVTIHGNVEDKKRAYEVGGVDFITKPFHPDEVLARVENQLHGAFLLHTIQRASEKFLHEMKMNAEILVVDDVPDNLQLLLDLLKSKGYKIRPANTGELALASISARKPDLILLDLKLPGLNGFEVCKKLKADPETRDIPVIFLTARNDVIDKVAAFEAGGADFVTKPFQPEEVLARVENQLHNLFLRKQLETANLRLVNEMKVKEEADAMMNLFFAQSLIGYFFMMLEEPIEWNESVDKEKALDYVFSHQHITKVN